MYCTTFAWSVQQLSPRPREAPRPREPYLVPPNARDTVRSTYGSREKSVYDVFPPSLLCLLGPHTSSRRTLFLQKGLLAFVDSSALNDNSPGRKRTSSQWRWCPNKKTKKCRFCPTQAVFRQNCWNTDIFDMRCTFSPGASTFNAEIQSKVSFFEKTSVGPRD